MTEDLMSLAERCEAAEGADRELDAWITVALGAWPNTLEAEQSVTDEGAWSVVEREPDGRKVDRFSPPAYTASIDAALLLKPSPNKDGNYTFATGDCHEEEYDSWACVTAPPGDCTDYAAHAATPALAICAAALKARSAAS